MRAYKNLIEGTYICRTTDLCFDTAVHENHRINNLPGTGLIAVLLRGVVKGRTRWYNEVYSPRALYGQVVPARGVGEEKYEWREKGREQTLHIWRKHETKGR